jgi:hypothetical protein
MISVAGSYNETILQLLNFKDHKYLQSYKYKQ